MGMGCVNGMMGMEWWESKRRVGSMTLRTGVVKKVLEALIAAFALGSGT
jgi:hypothetical protein